MHLAVVTQLHLFGRGLPVLGTDRQHQSHKSGAKDNPRAPLGLLCPRQQCSYRPFDLQDRSAFTEATEALRTQTQLVCARCGRGARPAAGQQPVCCLHTLKCAGCIGILLVQGSSGAQTSKGKKGKKGADTAAPAGASTVSSGIKLENVRRSQLQQHTCSCICICLQHIFPLCHLYPLAVVSTYELPSWQAHVAQLHARI